MNSVIEYGIAVTVASTPEKDIYYDHPGLNNFHVAERHAHRLCASGNYARVVQRQAWYGDWEDA